MLVTNHKKKKVNQRNAEKMKYKTIYILNYNDLSVLVTIFLVSITNQILRILGKLKNYSIRH
jgi:hypothetical protein